MNIIILFFEKMYLLKVRNKTTDLECRLHCVFKYKLCRRTWLAQQLRVAGFKYYTCLSEPENTSELNKPASIRKQMPARDRVG